MLDAEQWAELRATYRGLSLRMPCCGVPAIPKTSNRGTYFFAHARRGDCTTADESPEHLYCKSLIAKAALDVGWTVTTERTGVSPAGEAWMADVFCERGTAQLALEVQMSPQTDEETTRRQLRYKASGVRGAWFFGARARLSTVLFDRETPTFSLYPIVAGELPTLKRFEVSLPEFVTALLQKRVCWTIPRYRRPLLVEFVEDTCWACKKPVKQVLGHMRGGESPDGEALTAEDFYEGRWNPTVYTVSSLSNKLEAIKTDISNEELAVQGLNLIGRQDAIRGKPTRFPFCNLCLHCHAPQNNFYLSKHVYASTHQPESDADDGFLRSPGDTKTDDADEPSAFGIAVIPREVVGSGMWVLQEPPGQATS